MKKIIDIINEDFTLKNKGKINNNEDIKYDDPTSWIEGDILTGTYHYNNIMPMFFKIIKRTNKSFTLIELYDKIVKGSYNGNYEVVADEEKIEKALKCNDKITTRINNNGDVVVKRNIKLRLWDGTPQSGCGFY